MMQIAKEELIQTDAELEQVRTAIRALHFPILGALVPKEFCDYDRLPWPCPAVPLLDSENED